MSMEWYSWVIAIALGFAAILTPAITAFINNRHQIRLKQITDFETNKQLAIENLINSVYKLIKDDSLENKLNYKCCLANLYLYIPREDCLDLERITSRIDLNDNDYPINEHTINDLVAWASLVGEMNIHTYKSVLPKSPKQILHKLYKGK